MIAGAVALSRARVGTVAVGLVLTLAGPAGAAVETINVPDDFDPARSDTRATGHREVPPSS